MRPEKRKLPALRIKDKSWIAHLGTSIIPITSPTPEAFDVGPYGTIVAYSVDGWRLTAYQTLSLAGWIVQTDPQDLNMLLDDIWAGKISLECFEDSKVVWVDAKAWG